MAPAAGCRVIVPASSANLGPGFDTFAAALSLHLDLVVRPARRFAVDTELDVPRDRTNLVVRAFERLRPADRLRFEIRSEIPLTGGLGSSAAAIVAGLCAAARLGPTEVGILELACELEGHPDNVAAALHGGVVICADGQVVRFQAPPGLDAVLVVPEAAVPTAAARAALPAEVPLTEAVFNTAHGALLMLGLVTGDWNLLSRGLVDRLHQPRRAHLFPASHELLGLAPELGALGATISGAGPTVLFWSRSEDAPRLLAALEDRVGGWARVLPAGFEAAGARASAI
ncbi:MAG: homoserine kinase [Solirubrobacteraceae bacterium]|jgi:homoserine kinase|nr:homoserine kinase [Solirubrobacteraceae bacterium]